MKKTLICVMILAVLCSCVACGKTEATTENTATTETTGILVTTPSETNTETITPEEKLLESLLATGHLALCDEEYHSVVEYIQQTPAQLDTTFLSRWELDQEYTLVLNKLTRELTLQTGRWSTRLCENIDTPNYINCSFDVIRDFTFDVTDPNGITIYQYGKVIEKFEMAYSERRFIGIASNQQKWIAIIASDTNILAITHNNDGHFSLETITTDSTEDVHMIGAAESIWYINHQDELVHLNPFTGNKDIVAQDVTNLSTDIGNHSVYYYIKGDSEPHIPGFYVTSDGKIEDMANKPGV